MFTSAVAREYGTGGIDLSCIRLGQPLGMAGKPCFWDACQEFILDKKTPGMRFDQCLQGFCSLKISVTMSCGDLAVWAIMGMRKASASVETATDWRNAKG